MIERFKIREKLSIGTKEFLLEVVRNPYTIAKQLSPMVNPDTVTLINAARSKILQVNVERVQKIFLKNILSINIPSRTVDLMEKEELIGALAAAASVLITDGFEDIAPFLTASIVSADTSGTIATDQHQNKVPAELRESLNELLKFQRSSKSKIVTNPLAENVDLIFKEISNNAWYNNFPDELMTSKVRRMQIPSNLRIRLTMFALYLGERQTSLATLEDKLNLI